jgi:hypothetical protein
MRLSIQVLCLVTPSTKRAEQTNSNTDDNLRVRVDRLKNNSSPSSAHCTCYLHHIEHLNTQQSLSNTHYLLTTTALLVTDI